MADPVKQKEDVAVGAESESPLAIDTALRLTRLAVNFKKPQTTAAPCKRRADHIIQIVESVERSYYRSLIHGKGQDLKNALLDEKNHTSEAMQKVVLAARDVFKKASDTQVALGVLLRETLLGEGLDRPLYYLLVIQERLVETMRRKMDSMTASPEMWDD
ncbi:hypothetical protein D0859_11933 [Hortaea werneckii]|uniref:Uncharacterized protein n=1 Tax=Hortaea werneckii TaxID=91943 RepID=A0A3M7IEW6_HORWE|nr:hypothetical protein D0859_11933 [Hortaea werneckii]